MKTPSTDAEAFKPQRKIKSVPAAATVKAAKAAMKISFGEKILDRSAQRSGEVGGGTLLSSGNWQVTCVFTPTQIHKLRLVAAKNGVSISEAIRQMTEIGFEASYT